MIQIITYNSHGIYSLDPNSVWNEITGMVDVYNNASEKEYQAYREEKRLQDQFDKHDYKKALEHLEEQYRKSLSNPTRDM